MIVLFALLGWILGGALLALATGGFLAYAQTPSDAIWVRHQRETAPVAEAAGRPAVMLPAPRAPTRITESHARRR